MLRHIHRRRPVRRGLRWTLAIFGIGAAVIYVLASSALRDLDDAALLRPLPEPPISTLQRGALFVAAQVLPLRQPGAQPVAPGERFRDCETCPEMVMIQPGYFLLGSPVFENGRYQHVLRRRPIHRELKYANREGPRRLVRIPQALAFSRYEVTVAAWRAAQQDSDWQAITGRPPYMPDLGPDYGPDRPMTRVDWDDARAYAAYMSAKTGAHYRLPTDAEWEYAARAGSVTRFPWGNTVGQDNAACKGCSSLWTQLRSGPVGLHPPNRFGLHDMNGNGFEWVEDCFEPYHDSVKTDGSAHVPGPCEFRTVRGGSAEDDPWQSRSGFRVGPHYYNRAEGFVIRLVREVDPTQN